MIREDELISVIIPVYNVEEYVDRCIESVINQTYKNLEIIIVDDGSSDETFRIAQKYASMDSRVCAYKKDNGGVTSARKYGLEKSRGKYVAFVDGDDYIDSNMYSILNEIMVREKVQVVLSQHVYRVYPHKTEIYEGGLKEGSYYIGDNTIQYIRENMRNHKMKFGVLPFVWCNLYSREIAINMMKHIPDDLIFSEDATYIYMLLSVCESVSVINKALYYYNYREDSSVKTNDDKLLINMGRRYEVSKAFFEKNPYRDILIRQLKQNITEDYLFHFLKNTVVIFPYEKIPKGSKLILYAAGNVGKSYYKQITINHYCEIVKWVDKNVESVMNGVKISKPEEICDVEYDYILVSVQSEKMSKLIYSELKNKYGIDEGKIVTHSPNSFLDLLDF